MRSHVFRCSKLQLCAATDEAEREVEKHSGRLRIIEASSPPATAPLTRLPDEDANATNDVALHSDL
ncbi:hypothetical protein IG631_21160 [Alternaria alternata]|nr:hypothetical protein IG631_21160 [Alternaria alternata]